MPASFNEFEGMAGDDVITGNGNTVLSYLNAARRRDGRYRSAGQRTGPRRATWPMSAPTPSPACKSSAAPSSLIRCWAATMRPAVEVFQGRGGNDFIDGGGGFDRALYWFRTDDNVTGGITVNLAAGTVIGDASVGSDTLRSIEAVRGTNFADSYDATGFTTTISMDRMSAVRDSPLSVAQQPSTNSKGWAATTPSPATATRGFRTSTPRTA